MKPKFRFKSFFAAVAAAAGASLLVSAQRGEWGPGDAVQAVVAAGTAGIAFVQKPTKQARAEQPAKR